MTAQHDGPGSRGSSFVFVHSDLQCHSMSVGTGQEECRGGVKKHKVADPAPGQRRVDILLLEIV